MAVVAAGCGSSGGGSSAVPASSATSTAISGTSSNPSISFGTLSTAAVAIGEKRTFTPAEAGYSGTFTATTTNAGIISVSPASGAGPFTITGVAPGTATITLTDSNGHTGSVILTVGPSGTPTAPPAGTPTTAPTGAPTTTPTNTPITYPSSTPTTAPSTTPTSGPTTTPTSSPTTTPTSTPTSAPTATPTPTPAPIAVTPTSLNLGIGTVGNLAVSLPGGGSLGSVSVTTPNTSVAAVVPLGNGMFTVVANGTGSVPLVVADGNGHQLDVNVTVPSTPPLIMLGATALNLQLAGLGVSVSTVSASESGYSGSFTISSSNTGVVTAVPIPLTNNFLVTSVGSGAAILTVSDSNGNHTDLGLTVQ